MTQSIPKIALLGDYLPRKCGIATFTKDLYTSVKMEFPKVQCSVISVNDVEEGYDYPTEVCFEIEEQDLTSYQRAADFLNITDVDVVCLQHEFGIFGGRPGAIYSQCSASCRFQSSPLYTRFSVSPIRSSDV